MLYFIEILIFIPLTLMVGYISFFSIAGNLSGKRRKRYNVSALDQRYRIAILVPSYKEDNIIVSTAERLTRLNYPRELLDIYVIADSLQNKTLYLLQQLPIKIIAVAFDKSTKALALNAAMQKISKPYDIAVICDADNVFHANFLTYVASAFGRGIMAMQGQRVAKNMNTAFSILDGASEIINNHIFRKGHAATGLSSSVIGSGMAFSYSLLRETMQHINATGGFDKVLQLAMVKQGIQVAYLENALLFDEKISHASAFDMQRKRWLSSQFIYLNKFFLPGLKMLLRGNIDYFNLAVMHNFILPRVILLGILPLLLLISILLKGVLSISTISWAVLCLVYFIALLTALPKAFFRRQFLKALLSIPHAFFLMSKGLLRIKNADKTFIHTDHHEQGITNPMFKTDGI